MLTLAFRVELPRFMTVHKYNNKRLVHVRYAKCTHEQNRLLPSCLFCFLVLILLNNVFIIGLWFQLPSLCCVSLWTSRSVMPFIKVDLLMITATYFRFISVIESRPQSEVVVSCWVKPNSAWVVQLHFFDCWSELNVQLHTFFGRFFCFAESVSWLLS